MTEEKVLAFLNLEPEQPVDTFTMKLYTWFNVSFGAFVVFFGYATRILDVSWYNILFTAWCLVSNVLFFVSIHYIKKNKKRTYELFHHMSVSLSSVLILCYGWWNIAKLEFAENGYSIFGGIHVAALLASLGLTLYMISKFIWVLRLLKDHSLEETRFIISTKTSVGVPIVLVGAPSIMVFLRTFRGTFESLGIGGGVYMWVLMCIWLFFALSNLFKVLVILKYKIYRL